AFIVLPRGQSSVAWFSIAALLGMVVLINVGHWYKTHGITRLARAAGSQAPGAPRRHVVLAITVLLALVFSKYVYLASVTSYYTFYLIDHFHVSVRNSQLLLFVFLPLIGLLAALLPDVHKQHTPGRVDRLAA